MKPSSGRTGETATSTQMSVSAASNTRLHHISSNAEAPTSLAAFLSLASRNLPTYHCEKRKKKSDPSPSETAEDACTKINAVLWAPDRTDICAFLKITALILSLLLSLPASTESAYSESFAFLRCREASMGDTNLHGSLSQSSSNVNSIFRGVYCMYMPSRRRKGSSLIFNV